MKLFLLLIITLIFSACSHPKTLPIEVNKPEVIFPKIHYQKPLLKNHSLSSIGAKLGNPIFIRIFKTEQILELWIKVGKDYKLYNSYPILKTSGVLGPKEYEGDRQNPEGIYVITIKRLNRFSKYHLSINIGYPNRLDRNLGRSGSNIMIHGSDKSIGCFAMGNDAIEDIYPIVYTALDLGQKKCLVAIYPFIMTEKNMRDYKSHPWFPFWQNLKEGFELFNKDKTPPRVTVKGEKYIFRSAL